MKKINWLSWAIALIILEVVIYFALREGNILEISMYWAAIGLAVAAFTYWIWGPIKLDTLTNGEFKVVGGRYYEGYFYMVIVALEGSPKPCFAEFAEEDVCAVGHEAASLSKSWYFNSDLTYSKDAVTGKVCARE